MEWTHENGDVAVRVDRIDRENRPTIVTITHLGETITLPLDEAQWVAERIRDADALHDEQWPKS